MGKIRARTLRKNLTDAERWMWRQLRAHRCMGLQFRRQHPIDCYIVDFVCMERMLVIELDGGQHADDVVRDRLRTARLCRLGFRVIRFWNHDVLQRPQDTLAAIVRALDGTGAA